MTLGKSLITSAAVRRMAVVTLTTVSMVTLGVGFASAAPIITVGVSNTGTENVLFNDPTLPNDALTVAGVVQNSVLSVAQFEGTEALHSNGGQARIEGLGGAGYDSLLLSIPGNTFTKVVMNLNTVLGAGTGSVSFLLDGVAFGGSFAIGNGSNFFTIEGLDGTTFSTVQFQTTIDLQDTRQIRIGGVEPVTTTTGTPTTTTGTPTTGNVVPEPSVWALTLVGLASLGLRARARRA
jgi:hypothetical protein